MIIRTAYKLTSHFTHIAFQRKYWSCLTIFAMLFQTASVAKSPESSKPLPATSVIWPKDGPKTYEQATNRHIKAKNSQAAADKLSLLSGKFTGDDLFGLTKKDLLKRFPSPDFKHTADFSQVTWHGSDTSSILDLRFKDSKVVELRLSTHYGYPRPGTTSDVEVGKWLSAPSPKQN